MYRLRSLSLACLLAVAVFFAGCDDNKDSAKLPKLTTTDVSEFTSNRAISGGNITDEGGYEVNVRGICWRTDRTPTVNDIITTDGRGTGSFTSIMINLMPDTKYYVRAYATNNNGTAYGKEVSFTTGTLKPEDMLPIYRDIIRYSYSIDASLTHEANVFPAIYNYSFGANDINVAGLWNRCYDLILDADAVLYLMDTDGYLAQNVKDGIKAEAYYYIAYAYYVLLNYFGEVPLLPQEPFSSPRAPRDAIEHAILVACDEAYGRAGTETSVVNRYEILQLKARIMLGHGDYVETIECLQEIINSGKYTLGNPSWGTDAISQGIDVSLLGSFPSGFFKGNLVYPMRYAETELLYAEALLGMWNTVAAIERVNMFYTTQGMAEVLPPSATTAEIQAEIAKLWNSQLNKEGHTFSHLKRAGVFLNTLEQYGAQPRHELLPIPVTAIETNPYLTQNPGW